MPTDAAQRQVLGPTMRIGILGAGAMGSIY